MTLEYSDDALAVRPRFFAQYNEITIVIEDMAGEAIYTQIMKRLLGPTPAIHSVLAMGGKTQVIQRFQNRGFLPGTPTEFYIVDGDFDELIDRPCPLSKYFYRLNRYDIESYLIEELSICTVAQEEQPRKSLEQHRGELKIHPWQLAIVQAWSRLVSCAALLQKAEKGTVKLGLNVERYRSKDEVVPDKSKIESAIKGVFQGESVTNQKVLKQTLAEMAAQMGESYRERLRWVSGKDVWIPLVIRLLRQHTGRNFRRDSLCFRLAKYCEFHSLDKLRQQIVSIVTVDAAKKDAHPS